MRLIDGDALDFGSCRGGAIGGIPFVNLNDVANVILSAPAIEPTVVRGKWLQRSYFDEDANVYVCSVCDEPWMLNDGTPADNNMHFCPNCGADMREDKP